MSTRKRLADFKAMAAARGLTLVYVASDDPQLSDDEINIYCEDQKTTISIQIGQCGWFYINEHTYVGDTLDSVKSHGEFRSLAVALDRALTLASKDAPYAN